MVIPRTEIQKYLKIVVKRRVLFIVLSLIIMSVIVWGGYFLPKKYEASSTVFIENNVIKNLVGGIAITPSMSDRVRVLRYAMLSRGLISKVLKDLDIDAKVKNDKNFEELITSFQERTKLNIKGSDLFFVSIQDPNPKLAANYINTLVRKYVEENTSSKREESYGANRFLSEQVAILKEKLDKAEDAIIKFRQKEGIFVSVDERSLLDEMKNYRSEVENIKVKKNELIATMNSVKKQLQGEEPFTVAILSRSENSKDANVAALENRLKQLLVKYTDNYPEVIKLRAEIGAMKKQQDSASEKSSAKDSMTQPEMSTANPIYQELRQKQLQAESEISALDAKQRQLMVMIGARESELRHLPEGKRKLSALEKERDTQKALYEQLMMRQGQSEVAKQMEIEDKSTAFRIVDPAILPAKPVSPNIVLLIVGGIFVGFVGGLGGVFLRERIDTSVKETQMLRDLGLTVLAVIPKIFNEDEQLKTARRDKLIYTVSGAYFLIICSNLLLEVMGVSLINSISTTLGIDELLNSIAHVAKRIF